MQANQFWQRFGTFVCFGLIACQGGGDVGLVNVDLAECLEPLHLTDSSPEATACRERSGLVESARLGGCFIWRNGATVARRELVWDGGWRMAGDEEPINAIPRTASVEVAFFVGPRNGGQDRRPLRCDDLEPSSECTMEEGCLVKLKDGRFRTGGDQRITFVNIDGQCGVESNLPDAYSDCVDCGLSGCVADSGVPDSRLMDAGDSDMGVPDGGGLDAESLVDVAVQDRCGDGVQTGGEGCDRGDENGFDCPYGEQACIVCTPGCQLAEGETAFCGDRVQNGEEECDDGNAVTESCELGTASCQVCDEHCRLVEVRGADCGNGEVDEGESCDDGAANGSACEYGQMNCPICTNECTIGTGDTSWCGDGAVDEAYEECDHNGQPQLECDYGEGTCQLCSQNCLTFEAVGPFCGDGEVRTSIESCDHANENGRSCEYGYLGCAVCGDDCQPTLGETSYCGDGNRDLDEACDDGNRFLEVCPDGESCSVCGPDCSWTLGATSGRCGDGIVDPGEQCDRNVDSSQPYGLFGGRCDGTCQWRSDYIDIRGLVEGPIELVARVTAPNDPDPQDEYTVDLDWWIFNPAAAIAEPMEDLDNVSTSVYSVQPWLGNTTIEDEGHLLTVAFQDVPSCFPHENRMLLGLHAYDLRITGLFQRYDARVELSMVSKGSGGMPDFVIFETELLIDAGEEDDFFAVGFLSMCNAAVGTGVEIDFTGFLTPTRLRFNPF